jgi:Flp pilus assembly protein CpaB
VRTLTNENHPGLQDHRQYRTVTVAVTPQDAAKITLAQDAGKITITLRQPEDAADLDLPRITKHTLLFGQPATSRTAARKRIEIILGGT